MYVSAAGSGTSRMPWVSVTAALVVPLVVTTVAHLVDPEEARRARVQALAGDVDALRASLQRQAADRAITSCGSADLAHTALEDGTAAWRGDACWSNLDVKPTTDRAFWVVGGVDDFAVHGIADMDGDGVPIEFVATRAHAAEPWTAPGVL